jgi:manganese/iron transport system permease protein
MSDFLTHHGNVLYPLITLIAVGTACAVMSVFVVLLKWAFIGEGISHAGFGGAGTAAALSLAVPALGTDFASFSVAVLFCFATAGGIGWVSRRRAVSGDSAIGVFVVASLAWGFVSFGLSHHSLRSGSALPGDAFLVGSIDEASLTTAIAGVAISIFVLTVVGLLGRQILLYCFDPTLAKVTGVPVALIHYVLIFLMAFVVVAGTRLLGYLLMPALFILPGALALALTVRLDRVMMISVSSTLLAVLLGVAVNAHWSFIEIGPAVVLVLFVEFLTALALRRA